MKRNVCLLLCVALAFALACPALGADILTPQEAGQRMREIGIFHGNDSGDLMLDKGLTRAELATILARLDDPKGEFSAYPQGFAYMCAFTDVPDWAKSPVGYSWNRGLVKGYGNGLFGAADMVTPDAACTVILRLYGHKAGEGDIWDYNTAGAYAVGLGLIPAEAIQGTAISRGNMAVLICNAMDGKADASPQETPAAVTTDHSQQANPAIFTGEFTRETYNAIRDTILNYDDIIDGKKQPVPLGVYTPYGDVDEVVVAIGNYPAYEVVSWPGSGYVCMAKYPEAYKPAVEHTQGFIDGLAEKSDREKVTAIAWYVADRITYEVAYPSPAKVLTQDGQVPGACMAYAYSFLFLCDRTGIPCILKRGGNHQWNMVYVDGQWWDVDVTAYDAGDNISIREYVTILNDPADHEMAGFIDEEPAVTAFAKELLVPGSTN